MPSLLITRPSSGALPFPLRQCNRKNIHKVLKITLISDISARQQSPSESVVKQYVLHTNFNSAYQSGMNSPFSTVIQSGQFALTTEITPPLSCDGQTLIDKVAPLKGLADAVNVTDGASARATMDPLAASAIMLQNGVEPILQLTCRDRNRIALQGALVGAAALGVRAFLMLTGDDPTKGDQPETKPVFDLTSNQLIETVATISSGTLPGGREISGRTALLAGCADAPIDPSEDWQPKSLLGKIASGARFAQTQFCMDAGVVRRYVARLRDCGVPRDFPLLIGVAPLASAKSARWIVDNLYGSIIPQSIIDQLDQAEDQRAEGRAIAIDLIRELASIDGVGGVHIMAPLNEKAVPKLLDEARSALAKG
jgi:methylenetetrahydrofolate reductase (NADPH)